MKTIYLDAEYHCHLKNDGTMQAISTDVFDWVFDGLIEYYKFIPRGTIKADGNITCDDFIQCFKTELCNAIQTAVDRTQAEADEQIMGLLDTIEELIIGG